MARKRTQKILARQLALDYFAKPFWLRSWRRRLTWGIFALGLLWLGFLFTRGDQRIYSAGPTALPHRTIEADCAKCHATFDSTPDAKCLACHPDQQAPHQRNQTTTPVCSACHLEHRGRDELARVADSECTSCHADLRTIAGPSKDVAARVSSFDSDHPEFGAIAHALVDDTRIRLNHALHLRLSKDDPKLAHLASRLPLACGDCHLQDDSGRHFQPIVFEQTCQNGCHVLTFDDKEPTLQAPHDEPERIRGFLEVHYGARTKADAAVVKDDASPSVTARVERAEVLLYEARCVQCHTKWMKRPASPGDLYEFEPINPQGAPKRWLAASYARTDAMPSSGPTLDAGLPRGWLTRASFDHASHRAVRCDSCHAKAVDSKETEDVLLPGIASCRSCHKFDGGARTACTECHLYHDRASYQKRGGTLRLGFENVKDDVR